MNRSAMRTLFVILGMFVLMLENGSIQAYVFGVFGVSLYHFAIGFIGVTLSLYGYFLWARLKGRHWVWMFLGLVSPIGTVPIAILKDRS